jgi:uncharacterized protein (TIGR03083 family)
MGAGLMCGIDVDTLWAVVDRERSELAELFAGLSEREWQTPSLCAGWRVRDVAAHLALAHTGPGRAAADLVRAGGSFDRMIRDSARRRAATASRDRIAAEIRALCGSRRTAPGVSPLEPLLDVLVHGQDVAIPLGLTRTMPLEAARAAATRVWTMPWPMSRTFRARDRLRGLEVRATDTEWSVGDGRPVEGPMEALLLLLTGRTAAAVGRLSGDGVRLLDRP